VPGSGSWALTVLGVVVVVFMAVLPDGLSGVARIGRALLARVARRGPGSGATITEVSK
jgi:branched-chain amino acid transport system permease protein